MKIAIIGAGVTGSLCAYQLSRLGHNVTVLEKSRGKGGRCSHKRASWGEFDLGAPVMPVTDQNFANMLEVLVQQQLVARWPAQTHRFDGKELSQVQREREYYVFTKSMNSACHYWLNDISLVKDSRIMHLQKTHAGWWLWDEQERKFGSFDWVIVTAPWPQTHPLLAEVLEDLPALKSQLWSSCWTVACQLNQSLGDKHQLIYAGDDFPVQTLVLDSSKPMRDPTQQVWVAYLNNQVSDDIEKSDLSRPESLAEEAFRQIFDQPELYITHSYQHYWRYARPHKESGAMPIVHDEHEKVSACGDWTSGASVQASYQSVQALLQKFV